MHRTTKVLALCTLCLAGPALAQSAPDKAIEYRQQLYRSLEANLIGIVLNLRQEVAFPENVPVHASNLAAIMPLIKAATEQNTAGQGSAKTEAKPAIWDDWATFERLADAATAQAEKLAEVVATGDMAAIGAQVQATGGACKECHDRFRE